MGLYLREITGEEITASPRQVQRAAYARLKQEIAASMSARSSADDGRPKGS